MVVLLIGASFAIGSMWTKIQYLQTPASVKTTAGEATQPTQPNLPAAPAVKIDQIKALFAEGFIHFGDGNRKILLTEISDPSCPYCHYAGGKNPELSKTSGRFQYVTDGGSYTPPGVEIKKLVDAGKASFVWIYANGHGNGELGAQAFYCAFEKGKFWPAHDLLMSNKGYELMNMEKAPAATVAAFLAPVVEQNFMKDCLESKKYLQNLARDQQTAQTLGFGGTPHFFVNTTPFGGAVDYKQAMEPVIKPLL